MTLTTDILIIGSGIAGASVAACLASQCKVLIVDREDISGYHATGRSVATFSRDDGVPGSTLPLTLASQAYLSAPPDHHSLLRPRGLLKIVSDEERARERANRQGRSLPIQGSEVSVAEAVRLFPALRSDVAGTPHYLEDVHDLDVAGLHQLLLRRTRRKGGEVRLASPVRELRRQGGTWRVRAGSEDIHCQIVINAAGGWADEIAKLAGLRPVGLRPLLRSAFTVTGPAECGSWPLVVDASTGTYFKPDGPQLLCSPGDETPVEPHDVRPDQLSIAQAIDVMNETTTLGVRAVRTAWAGLRTFTSDRAPVIGFDPDSEGFFWLAGQGGAGIQTAPAAGRLAGSLVRGDGVPADVRAAGFELARVLPERFRDDS